MSKRRPPEFSFDEAVLDPGYSPRAGDLPALLPLLEADDERVARGATRALARSDAPVAEALRAAYGALSTTGRALACRVAGLRLGAAQEQEALRALLWLALGDAHPKARRAAVSAASKLDDDETRSRLGSMLGSEVEPTVRRELVRALGKLGATELLEELVGDEEAEPEGLERARLVASRSGERERSSVDLTAPVGAPLELALRCRSGLEEIVVDELAALGIDALAHPRTGRVKARIGRTDSLERVASARTAIDFSLVLRRERARGESDATLVAACLSAPEVEAVVKRLTHGPARFRLEWLGAGKRRAETWEVAAEMARRGALLVNDPTDSVWHVRVAVDEPGLRIDLVPRHDDERFTYRVADVPAASHPTLAAAIARLGGVRPADVVWDPFVGSGLELCERARLGDYRKLIGHDTDPAAIERARRNLESLGAANFELVTGDARRAELGELSLVLTNPPMGRRVRGETGLEELLEGVIERAARLLAPGGRLVLASPRPRATRQLAEARGLELTDDFRVDLGGFDAELQRFERR
jgi:23S rRNA G2445 N2-methylase RlmL